jgi:hypothetical protein
MHSKKRSKFIEQTTQEDELYYTTKENKNLDECCNYVMKCAKVIVMDTLTMRNSVGQFITK